MAQIQVMLPFIYMISVLAIGLLLARPYYSRLGLELLNETKWRLRLELFVFLLLLYATATAKLLPFTLVVLGIGVWRLGLSRFRDFAQKGDPLGVGDIDEEGEQSGTGFRAHSAPPSTASSSGMSTGEALEVLGFEQSEAPTQSAIDAAHKRLMRQVHPDIGGSTYLSVKINQARETLKRL